MTQHWKTTHTITLFAILVAIVLLAYFVPEDARPGAFVGTMILLAGFTATAGHGITGIWRGALIDERNKMSLARFQLLAWTILLLSGFLVAVLSNLALDTPDPVAIEIPQEVWWLLGISTTSLIGSPLIRTTKRTRDQQVPGATRKKEVTSSDIVAARTFDQLASQGIQASQLDTEGLIVENQNPRQARWSDLFGGEETANAAQLDLGKVQMFYFTVVLLLVYAVTLGTDLGDQTVVDSFPELSEGMIALLGISHAGYLTHKAVPHTKTA